VEFDNQHYFLKGKRWFRHNVAFPLELIVGAVWGIEPLTSEERSEQHRGE
jgi:hypothetical protein